MIVTSILLLLITFTLVCYSIQKIIYISHKKHLFDEPLENRKIHLTKTPNLGGVAIFASLTLTAAFFLPANSIPHLNYIIAAGTILFITGLIDDLVGMHPVKKMLSQLVVTLIITLLADMRLTSLYGFLGIYEIHYVFSVILTVLFILLLTNAFNLIDGINCLAGSIGLLSCLVFAWCFWQVNEAGYMLVAIALCGGLTGFLLYNSTPARIFMGDTGSLVLGFTIALFSIKFLESNKQDLVRHFSPELISAPAIVFGLLIIPIFDTLRVFTLRILNRKSPFHADRNHIHHLLIDSGFSHLQATGILVLVNILCLLMVFILHRVKTELIFLLIIGVCVLLNRLLKTAAMKKNMNVQAAGTDRKKSQSYIQPQAGLITYKEIRSKQSTHIVE
jgi:UDP-N-acetylmuramyl pentapeptide phosphotransferase/UDP-N-acetylglucosamine-1-phosphate transferase